MTALFQAILMGAFALTLVACDEKSESRKTADTGDNNAAVQAAIAPVAYSWLGRWTGVEGTFLNIVKDADAFQVEIQSLDGKAQYPATVDAKGLTFEREGVRETIRAGDGIATGMKWLLDKTDCLVIKTGEGYCRG